MHQLMLATVDPDLFQLITVIVGAVLSFFGAKRGSRRN